MQSIKRILYAGDYVYWNHHEEGTVPCKVMENEDCLYPKIKVTADLPGFKHPVQRWVMKVRLLEDEE